MCCSIFYFIFNQFEATPIPNCTFETIKARKGLKSQVQMRFQETHRLSGLPACHSLWRHKGWQHSTRLGHLTAHCQPGCRELQELPQPCHLSHDAKSYYSTSAEFSFFVYPTAQLSRLRDANARIIFCNLQGKKIKNAGNLSHAHNIIFNYFSLITKCFSKPNRISKPECVETSTIFL